MPLLQIALLICAIVLVTYTKPSIIYKPNGKPREYGFGKDSEGFKKTIFTLQTFIITAVLLTFALTKNKKMKTKVNL